MCKSNLFSRIHSNIVAYQTMLVRLARVSAGNTEGLDQRQITWGGGPSGTKGLRAQASGKDSRLESRRGLPARAQLFEIVYAGSVYTWNYLK